MQNPYDLSEDPEVPIPHQDTIPLEGDALPSYQNVTAEPGNANGRFGRWRGWIEKRAGERYLDRHERKLAESSRSASQDTEAQLDLSHLRIETDIKVDPFSAPPDYSPATLAEAIPFCGELLGSTSLQLNQFGSRFLSHAKSQINCLLPLAMDQILLIGHNEGLSVLDTYPKEWSEDGDLNQLGPDLAQSWAIWEGEIVYQMTILEMNTDARGTVNGLVLVLVGPTHAPDSPAWKEQFSTRSLRLYNLASLVALAKRTISEKGENGPIDFRQHASWTPSRKHKHAASISRSLKTIVVDSPVGEYDVQSIKSSPVTTGGCTPERQSSSDTSWDVVDDSSLQWASSYTPFAAPGSKLSTASVLAYTLWRESGHQGAAFLAVSTKGNIIVYQKLKSERAFRFYQEYYTPFICRSLSFVQQQVADVRRRTPSESVHNTVSATAASTTDPTDPTHSGSSASQTEPDSRLCLFVIFEKEKKAGIIRLADSAVQDVELPGIVHAEPLLPRDYLSASLRGRRDRKSMDGHRDAKCQWSLPTRITVPIIQDTGDTISHTFYALTFGKTSHILPSPLPAYISSSTPIFTIVWSAQCERVCTRISKVSQKGSPKTCVQVISFGDDGVEVQEFPLSAFFSRKGKQRSHEPVRACSEFGGASGFLCTGGHWHLSEQPSTTELARSHTFASNITGETFDSLDTEEQIAKLQEEQGVYGWCQRGINDFRVVWVGGVNPASRREGEDSEC